MQRTLSERAGWYPLSAEQSRDGFKIAVYRRSIGYDNSGATPVNYRPVWRSGMGSYRDAHRFSGKTAGYGSVDMDTDDLRHPFCSPNGMSIEPEQISA
jgi:hypothetical protein